MVKARILIVEDEAIIAMELENSLQKLGYGVTSVVNSGDTALENAEADRPDLILMDIRIKGEIDGIDAAEIIREKYEIPVVFSTAYLDEERIKRARITMPFGYVLKPIQERDLKVTLEMALYTARVDYEKRKANQKLLESQILFSEVFEQLPITLQLFDPDGYCIRGNARFREVFGVREEDIIEKKYNILHDKNLMSPRISSLVNEIFFEKKTNKWEAQFDISISADLFGVESTRRDAIDVETIGYPVLDSAGNLKYVVMHTDDITERKQSEQTLRESENRRRQAQKLSKVGHWDWFMDTKELVWSDEVYEIFGQDQETFAVTAERFEKTIHPDDLDRFISERERALAEKRDIDIEHRIILPDSSIRWVHELAEIIRDENGNVTRLMGVVQDMTGRT